MEKLSAAEENRIIRENRLKRGKLESRIYPIIFMALCVITSLTTMNFILLFGGILVSVWLLSAAPFGRTVYSWGNFVYGFYLFYVFTYILPARGIKKEEIIVILIFLLYIIFSSIKVFSSEAIKAYLYEKNSD